MNKKELLELLHPYLLKENISEDVSISALDWKIQNDEREVALFLKYTENLNKLINEKQLISTVITTHDLGKKNQIIIKEDKWLQAQKVLCDHFYPIDSKSFVIGITGTNGKTSTAFFLTSLLEQNNIKTATIGTLGMVDGVYKKTIKDFSLTSPSYIDIRKILSHYYGEFQAYVFEVSSHALEQERFYDISFDSAGWTSFSQDHLDFHKTMDDYFRAKLLIFEKLKEDKNLVLSTREEALVHELSQLKKNISLSYYPNKSTNPIFMVAYNQANFDVAFGILNDLVKDPIVHAGLITAPPGRYQVIKQNGYEVVLDFAHTPDALENVVKAIKNTSERKLLTVFGCGGDRDPSKRASMGSVVEKYSDILIITSDNPRFESPDKIIDDIQKGLQHQKEIHIKIDRKEAIEFALKSYKDCIILIAGKGHENYLDIKGVKYPYSDLEEIKRWIE